MRTSPSEASRRGQSGGRLGGFSSCRCQCGYILVEEIASHPAGNQANRQEAMRPRSPAAATTAAELFDEKEDRDVDERDLEGPDNSRCKSESRGPPPRPEPPTAAAEAWGGCGRSKT